MNFWNIEVVTAPTVLPVEVDDADKALAAAVTEECERLILWRAIVHQTRRSIVDGALPPKIEIEPLTAIVSVTRWTPSDAAEVIPAANYNFVSRDPAGCIIQPNSSWPQPQRSLDSFRLNYECGWEVTDTTNLVPASILLMLTRAVEFRAGSGLGDLSIGSLDIGVADSYKTDALPREIASIGRAWNFRPGLFHAR